MIFISLEGNPVAKARARVGKWGAYTPKKSENYSTALAWEAKREMKGRKLLEGALMVHVCAYMPIPKSDKKIKPNQPHTKKPDIDNIIKQLDALNGIVWKDDSQIVYLIAHKVYSLMPRLTIQIAKC